MSKINIRIPEPCHEDWHAMTPEDKGRFCNSCQKKVFDFTKSSDREIVTAFHQNKNLCGRFLDSQLNRDLVKPEKKNPIWLATTSTIISFIGLGTNEAVAQTNSVQTEQTEKRIWLGKPAAPKPANENGYTKGEMVAMHPEIDVFGIVSDKAGPIPGVSIHVKGKSIAAQTDFDGKYTIKAAKDDILVFSFPGYKTTEVLIDNKNVANSKLQLNPTIMNEMILGGIVTERRSFFGRIFHAIGNWFR